MRTLALPVLILTLATGTLPLPGYAQDRTAPAVTAREIAERIKQLKPTEAMAWTKIPWVGSLAKARQVSRQEGCPVFLFSHLGNLGTGRC